MLKCIFGAHAMVLSFRKLNKYLKYQLSLCLFDAYLQASCTGWREKKYFVRSNNNKIKGILWVFPPQQPSSYWAVGGVNGDLFTDYVIFYTPRSGSIISLHILWWWQGKFVQQSKLRSFAILFFFYFFDLNPLTLKEWLVPNFSF